uniref:Uncharacterized protein n=1 Tax=Moniliophthora roreri TaxID=221103 RepID=A0A0W0F2E9_MONRR
MLTVALTSAPRPGNASGITMIPIVA